MHTPPELIILDRDGVINADSPNYIKSVSEFHPIEGSLQAIKNINDLSIPVCVATNQSGIGRRFYDESTLHQIHEHLDLSLRSIGAHIDSYFFCPHLPCDQCDCRKPKPGLLRQALRDFSVQSIGACFVGDSIRDLEAAYAADVAPHLVLTGNGMNTLPSVESFPTHIEIHDSLYDFSLWLMKHVTTS